MMGRSCEKDEVHEADGGELEVPEATTDSAVGDYFPEDGDVDSDQESYSPSIYRMMQENVDLGMEIEDDSSRSTSTKQEIENLIMESKIPIEELRRRYEAPVLPNEVQGHFGLDIMEPERKRRKLVQRYLFDTLSDYEDIFSSLNRKTVPIGPEHQIEVPDYSILHKRSLDLDTPPMDELVWDPAINPAVPLSEFFNSLSSCHPLIKFEDEMVMALYMKHSGNISSALTDQCDINRIISAHTSPLTCFTPDECREFKNAILKYGKNFNEIHLNMYPQYSVKLIVGFYYIWKKSPLYDDYLNELESRQRQQIDEPSEDHDVHQVEDASCNIPKGMGSVDVVVDSSNHFHTGKASTEQPQMEV